ncbi:hypothetical protein BGX27_006877 [Mortierella sp. AM989]|nr:hypothetical protein BGX27_006877 [Mortierella sp. AM989]
MFVLSWIRSSDAQASNASNAENNAVTAVDDASGSAVDVMDGQHQDDWVFLPSDHNDLMESSISDLSHLSASMTLYPARSSTSTASSHPASSRTRDETTGSSSGSSSNNSAGKQKSKRQLKQEKRQKRMAEEQERKPRYDPMIAKMQDHEFKLAKMAKLSMRNGNNMSSTSGGVGVGKGSPMSSRT